MTTLRSILFVGLLSWLALAALAAQERAAPPQAFDPTHALWTEVLAKHVRGDRFDYAALAKDRAALDRYLAQLHAVKADELATWSREQQMAFWINAYNAHVVSLVISEYPIESIKDLGGLFSSVWKKAFIDMPALHPSGKPGKLSLDDVEHKILRPKFKDARVHAAVNCASRSCPQLRAEAFVADRLNEQLDDQARKWLADSSRNKFDEAHSRIEISAIFQWFEEDFVRDGGSIAGWIAKYAPEADRGWLKGSKIEVRHLEYSWKLNDVTR